MLVVRNYPGGIVELTIDVQVTIVPKAKGWSYSNGYLRLNENNMQLVTPEELTQEIRDMLVAESSISDDVWKVTDVQEI